MFSSHQRPTVWIGTSMWMWTELSFIATEWPLQKQNDDRPTTQDAEKADVHQFVCSLGVMHY